MNKVVKVSIGNIAFTLEEEAHIAIDKYLNELSLYYEGNESGPEIIDGIEERMAELFVEKLGKDVIVTLPVAKEVIAILGKPEYFDQEENNRKESRRNNGKRLYRNVENTVLGGVFGGLGAYFNIDPIIFRVIYVILFVLSFFANWGIGTSLFIIYVIMWVIIPEAKTVAQKCAMKGDSTTIASIQKNVENGVKEVKNSNVISVLGTIVEKCLGFIFTIIGVVGVVTLVVVFFGVNILGMTLPFELMNVITLFIGGTVVALTWFKILLGVVLFLPFIGVLYCGIRFLFGFKSPKWKPGLIMFLIWLCSLIALFVVSISHSTKYWDVQNKVVKENITLQSDTIYVEFKDYKQYNMDRMWLKADRDEYDLMYYIESNSDADFAMIKYPTVELFKNENFKDNSSIESEKYIFTNTMTPIELQNRTNTDFYNFDGNTLTLYPLKYNADNKIKEMKREVTLKIDENVVVIVREPIYHQFESNFEYSNIPWLNNY